MNRSIFWHTLLKGGALAGLGLMAAFLASCSFAPEYERPMLDLPESYLLRDAGFLDDETASAARIKEPQGTTSQKSPAYSKSGTENINRQIPASSATQQSGGQMLSSASTQQSGGQMLSSTGTNQSNAQASASAAVHQSSGQNPNSSGTNYSGGQMLSSAGTNQSNAQASASSATHQSNGQRLSSAGINQPGGQVSASSAAHQPNGQIINSAGINQSNGQISSSSGSNQSSENLGMFWWYRFNDPVLNKIVAEALLHNQDMAIALARVDEARAALGIARAQSLPSIAGAFTGMREQQSANGSYALTEALSELLKQNPASRIGDAWSIGAQAAWELDLWGKFRNSNKAAQEQLMASEAARRGVALSLAGQACQGYFSLCNYDAQLKIAKNTLRTREEGLRIYEASFKAGYLSELDLLRAKTEAETMRSQVMISQNQVATAESALLLLLGRSPREIFDEHPERTSQDKMQPAILIPEGIPSTLLERRPDIMEAENTLRAATLQIGVARAAWFPSISLTGQLGTQSAALNSLFTGSGELWNYGVSATIPLFQGGKILGNLRSAEAKQRMAAAQYIKTVQSAFRDIRDALIIQSSTVEIAKVLESIVKNLNQSLNIANLRYENGYSPYLDVLDAQRSLFSAQIQLANIKNEHLNAVVQLCLALGGGWEPMPEPNAQKI